MEDCKNKVLLLYPKADAQDFTLIPLSLLYIAQPLIEEGIEVEIIDQRLEKDFFEKLHQRLTAELICIGINCITGPQIEQVLAILKFLKSITDIPLVLGGPHPTLFPEQTLASGLIDYVVIGKGEVPFLNLVKALKENSSLKHVSGIGFNENGKPVIRKSADGGIQIRDIPYQLVACYGKPSTIPILTSYGCPYNCAFCVEKVLHPQYQEVQLADVLYMIEKAVRLGPQFIDFMDDNFLVNIRRVIDLLQSSRRSGLNFRWVCLGRVDGVLKLSDDVLRFLKMSGLVAAYFGIESGSQRILDLIDKRISIEMVLALNLRMKKEGIQPHYSFMAGFPTETQEDVQQTIKLIQRLKEDNPEAIVYKINQYTPYPGTRLFDLAVKNGFEPPDTMGGWSRVYFYSKEYSACYDDHL